MSPHFTFGSFIIPYIVFIFSLYHAAVPRKLSFQTYKSTKRIILCGLGIAFGLYSSIKTLIRTSNDMNSSEAYLYLLGLVIFSWCIYSLFTNHSNLSKGKKIAKVIIYWLITVFFLSASSYDILTRLIFLGLNFIFAIIAYYTVRDREVKEKPSPQTPKIKSNKKHSIFLRLGQYAKRIAISLTPVWQYCINNKKIILITIIVVVVLLLLPFYIKYLINFSGLQHLLKQHHSSII